MKKLWSLVEKQCLWRYWQSKMENKKTNKKVNFQAEVLKALGEIINLLSAKKEELQKIVGADKSDGRAFIDGGDTIKDTKTGLMWAKEGSGKTMNYEEAERYCHECNIGGHNDWRMPTVDELESLVDRTKYNPAIVSDLFKVKTDDWYWTSTPYASYSVSAWLVGFYHGSVVWGGRDSGCYVRPVRQY